MTEEYQRALQAITLLGILHKINGSSITPRTCIYPRGWVASLASLGYLLGALLGFELTPQNQIIPAFWPPNAILLAFLVLTPRRLWWVLVAAKECL